MRVQFTELLPLVHDHPYFSITETLERAGLHRGETDEGILTSDDGATYELAPSFTRWLENHKRAAAPPGHLALIHPEDQDRDLGIAAFRTLEQTGHTTCAACANADKNTLVIEDSADRITFHQTAPDAGSCTVEIVCSPCAKQDTQPPGRCHYCQEWAPGKLAYYDNEASGIMYAVDMDPDTGTIVRMAMLPKETRADNDAINRALATGPTIDVSSTTPKEIMEEFLKSVHEPNPPTLVHILPPDGSNPAHYLCERPGSELDPDFNHDHQDPESVHTEKPNCQECLMLKTAELMRPAAPYIDSLARITGLVDTELMDSLPALPGV